MSIQSAPRVTMAQGRAPAEPGITAPGPVGLSSQLAGIMFRSIFLVCLAFGALWSSWPAGMSLAGVSNSALPDVVKAMLGLGICLGALVHLFILPKDTGAYRSWTYIGLFGIGALAIFVGYSLLPH